MTRRCTAPDDREPRTTCQGKHYSKGYCRKHYLRVRKARKARAEADSEPKAKAEAKAVGPTTYGFVPPVGPIPPVRPGPDPGQVRIGDPPPMGTGPRTVGPAPPPLNPEATGYKVTVGLAQIDALNQFLNTLAPGASMPLKLEGMNRAEVERALTELGATTDNPWVIIGLYVVGPIAIFIVMNYSTLRDNVKEMFGDLKGLLGGGKKRRKDNKVRPHMPDPAPVVPVPEPKPRSEPAIEVEETPRGRPIVVRVRKEDSREVMYDEETGLWGGKKDGPR